MSIQKFLDLCDKKRKVTVVGDCLLDLYYDVNAERVSPEFPIPVMRRADETPYCVCPGGAGNVAAQFRHFNMDVRYVGFLDEQAAKLLGGLGIDITGCIVLFDIPRKKRFYQGEFPLCRLDIETDNYGFELSELITFQKALFDNYKKFSSDIVVFSDYGKGVFAEGFGTSAWINHYANPITIVDPKDGPISRWKGCSIIKPNAKEAKELSGSDDWRQQCEYFCKETDCTACVITLGGKGVVGSVMGREFEYTPKKEVVADSVIGAGDTFVAFLAMALSYNMDIIDAAEVAFEAGAIYVQRKHNKAVAPYEFTKFVKPEWLRNRDFKLVFTNGCFDLGPHVGHLNTLRFAKSKGDKLVVALNDDASVRGLKGEGRPVVPLEERKQTIAALDVVDFVVEFSDSTPYNVIQTIQPDVLVKGADRKDPIGSDIVSEVYLAPFVDGKSTTNIIERITHESSKPSICTGS